MFILTELWLFLPPQVLTHWKQALWYAADGLAGRFCNTDESCISWNIAVDSIRISLADERWMVCFHKITKQ